jgi:hypothetical protein
MKCSRCSAELPASATYCFQCGQNFQSLSSPNASPYYQSDTFSYLPAGTPAWPTTIPTLSSTNTTPSALTPSDTKIDLPPKRSVGSLLAMVALALLVLILGVGLTVGTLFARGQIGNITQNATTTNKAAIATSTPLPQSQPTPQASATTNQLPTPASSKKISDADLNVLLQYPDNWDPDQIRKTTSTTTLDIHPHQPLNMIFFVIHLTDTVSSQIQSADDVNTAQIQSLSQQQGISSLQMIQSTNAQPTISGTTWTAQEATFQASSGDTYHLTVISTQHGKSYYTLLFWIPEVYYTEAMGKYIQPMIQSVQFIK